MNEQRKTYADLKDELLITRDQIAGRVKEMGAEITRDFEGKDLTVICILKGAVLSVVTYLLYKRVSPLLHQKSAR